MNTHENVRTQSDRAPAEIEAEIDQQRRHIEDIVGALEQKLTPSQLMQQAMEAGKSRARTKVDGMMGGTLDTIKSNPLPAALAAAGAAWLLASRDKETPLVVAHEHRNSAIPALLTAAGIAWLVKQARSRTSTTEIEVDAALLETATGPTVVAVEEVEVDVEGPGLRDRAGATVDEARMKASAAYGSAKATASDTVDSARMKAHQAADTASMKAHQAADSAKAKAHQASDSAKAKAHQAADTVSSKAHQATDAAKAKAQHAATMAREKAHRAGESMSRMLEEHPLSVGLAAVAAGALLGALLPPTRKENELMGQKRDELARRAKEMARTSMQEAKATAQEVASAAADAVESKASSSQGGSTTSGSSGSSGSSGGSSASGSTGGSQGTPASVTITEKTTVSATTAPGSQRPH